MPSCFRSIKQRSPKEFELDSFTTNHRQSTLRILTGSPEIPDVGNLTSHSSCGQKRSIHYQDPGSIGPESSDNSRGTTRRLITQVFE
ncbi:MAG: hypothetical protein DWH81_08835 [Planctomycetota bacterium]|nr:MAG: hypothetical protein DWH81_08835 [Planctomycetota bacterium]